mgnify:CR=1 FL=1
MVAATLKPMATIYVIDERFKAIWLAACGFLPKIPESHIAAVNKATSKNICKAEGNPNCIIFFRKYNEWFRLFEKRDIFRCSRYAMQNYDILIPYTAIDFIAQLKTADNFRVNLIVAYS